MFVTVRLAETTRQTALERVRAFVESQPTPRSANAAVALGLPEPVLRTWLHNKAKGMRPKSARKVAEFFSLPLEAVVFKHEPMGPIVRKLRAIVCDDRRRSA